MIREIDNGGEIKSGGKRKKQDGNSSHHSQLPNVTPAYVSKEKQVRLSRATLEFQVFVGLQCKTIQKGVKEGAITSLSSMIEFLS